MSGEEWQSVSHSARELIKGLLTVDASKRLSLTQVKNAEWIMSADVPHTPLMTPGKPCHMSIYRFIAGLGKIISDIEKLSLATYRFFNFLQDI